MRMGAFLVSNPNLEKILSLALIWTHQVGVYEADDIPIRHYASVEIHYIQFFLYFNERNNSNEFCENTQKVLKLIVSELVNWF